MPHLLLKYICHSFFGIYSIVIQYEKLMKPVPVYGKHYSTIVSWHAYETPSLVCDSCYTFPLCVPQDYSILVLPKIMYR